MGWPGRTVRWMLLGDEAAIDGHGYPRDERGSVGAEPDDGLGDLRRRAHPANWLQRGELRLGEGVSSSV